MSEPLVMSVFEEIPAFSIWETFHQTIPALMSKRPSERSAEHLAKIIKSGDFTNIFVYSWEPSLGVEANQRVADKYRAFTTWFLGRFFYLLSCKRLSKSHGVFVDIQLCVLDQLAHTQLYVYDGMAREYSKALNSFTKFVRSGEAKLVLEIFIPVKYQDLGERLNLDPISIELTQDYQEFLINFLKIMNHIISQNFDFQSFDAVTKRNLDDLIFLLSECQCAVKIEILKIFMGIVQKRVNDCEHPIIRRMELFSDYFEQVVYNIYSRKLPVTDRDFQDLEPLLLRFLDLNADGDRFLKITEFLLTARLDMPPSDKIRKFCERKRKEPLYDPDDFESYVKRSLVRFETGALCGLKRLILEDVSKLRASREGVREVKIFNYAPGKWKTFYFILIQTMEGTECTSCLLDEFLEFMIELTTLMVEIIIELKDSVRVVFVEESVFLVKILSLINRHFSRCEKSINFTLIYDLLLNLSMCSLNSMIFFDIFAYTFTSTLSETENPGMDNGMFRKELNDLCKSSLRFISDKGIAFDYLNKFLVRISSGLFELHQIHDMEITYMRIVKQVTGHSHITSLPHLLTIFNNYDRIISEILNPILSSSSDQDLKEVTRILPQVICVASSDFLKVTRLDSSGLKIEIYCDKCHLKLSPKSSEKKKAIDGFVKDFPSSALAINFAKLDLDLSALSGTILKSVLKFLTLDNPELKLLALDVLPFCSNHILKFYSGHGARIWVEAAGDQEETVRRRFGKVAAEVLRHAQDNKVLSEQTKDEIVTILYDYLLKLTKKALQETDIPLQETILDTLDDLGRVKCDRIVMPTVKNLIYLIMVPTSKHSFVAVSRLTTFARNQDSSACQIYKLYRSEICSLLTHLCVVNQTLIDRGLAQSLCKISSALGFHSAKDFISRECQHLLPFFVVKVIRSPEVGRLIDEMAAAVRVSLPELLANVYGNIFLHVFLNETKEDFKMCSAYLGNTTGLTSAVLRKRNLWIILNELLLNFHDKRDKVLIALRYLASEDSEGRIENIQDYLQSRLLGLLQHFDFKLMAKNVNRKGEILLSLADFLKYMGPAHIGPLRFKIIAMLRTADCGGFPEFNCEVWEAFIRSCEVELLGPQLATIFVSLLPLIRTCTRPINDIFKYLVVQNENHTKDYIKDLFFVDDQKVDPFVLQTIRKYTRPFEDFSLRDKMKTFLKYLTHETVEVRIRSLKQLKLLMETNREELDRMILAYNGIDPLIVDLIEILTLGCREKDPNLKLACGEVIGELGAVEPAHLPRRYAQNSRSFSFFINDDGFIVNSLNELTKALQGEKNTVNMDRFAVAIQEILKNYEISSDANSARHDLWKQFPDSQQALMLPLLTSRYIVSQPQEVHFSVPIYGGSEGASFKTWLYNWTRSLIATLPHEHQMVLHPCLPAMKQDNRILMLFLPHILLHSIISDVSDNREKMFVEITSVTGSGDVKQQPTEPESFTLPGGSKKMKMAAPERLERFQCTKVVFIVMDFLDRWTREWQWTNGSRGRSDLNFVKIRSFLERFCKLELAKCNYQCGEYPRALMYLEDYISENPHETCNQLTLLTKIYAQLDESDGVAGVTALQLKEPPIEQRILSLEVSGKLSDAAACYERLPQPLKFNHLKGLIQCYLDLDNVNTALNFAQGALDRQPEFGNMLLEMQAEPLWRLGRYEDLDTLLRREELKENTSWGVQIGKALLSFQNRDRIQFENLIQTVKSQQADLLGAASVEEGAYQHGYCYISRLHALNELEQVEKATYQILKNPTSDVGKIIGNLSKEWDLRIKVVQESVRIVEPLLCLRRVAIEKARRILGDSVPRAVPLLNCLLGDLWLYSAQTARAAGVHQQSYTYTLKAEEYAPGNLFVEKSKLHWLREEHEQALTTLRRGLEVVLPDSSKEAIASLSVEKRKICAEAKLLIATYNDKVSNVDTDIKTANYREASEMYKEWETGLVNLAQFYDRRFQNYSDEERDSKGSDMQIWMISYFCKSLRYGTAYVYQSLPRLLSLWFDYGTRLLDVTDSKIREERKNNLVKMTKLIDYALENLPAFVFLTAFSQIISRICHSQREVYVELKSIIIKLLLHYPQQCLWMIISVIKSSYEVRAKRCVEILGDPKLKTNAMGKLVRDFTGLAEKLIDLCNKKVSQDVESTTVSCLLRALPRMLSKPDFSEIMIPTHKFRKLVLPNPDFSSGEHNPFPNRYVHIVGIDEEVTVLRSLQRPRKITFRGSDGRGYIQMLKPKDDLRKDFRLMEFNDIVNQLLSREPEARQRRLNIRLYSVSPLNEECGLIEWIPNLVGLRPVIHSIYKQKGIGMTMKEIRDASCSIRDPLSKKREIFTKTFLQRHPPVLGEWFRRSFPDAQSWFFARTAYIRTTAVMSMVGYVLGLGDRHGENILLDAICGDAVHVDFNCLFNKGETFEWPERVPFRLTQNMVAAMGPLGVEGVFRKSCACTLRVLRTNANTLMSIVTPFVYDPLVTWSSNVRTSIHNTAEKTNEQALDHVKNIELRLQGIIVKSRDRSLSIPLSVDGQTNSLINEAMSVDNLCQMYVGWGPYF